MGPRTIVKYNVSSAAFKITHHNQCGPFSIDLPSTRISSPKVTDMGLLKMITLLSILGIILSTDYCQLDNLHLSRCAGLSLGQDAEFFSCPSVAQVPGFTYRDLSALQVALSFYLVNNVHNS